MFSPVTARLPADNNHGLTNWGQSVDARGDLAEQHQIVRIIDGKGAGAVERGPNDLGTDMAVTVAKHVQWGPHVERRARLFHPAGEEAKAVAVLSKRAADKAARKPVFFRRREGLVSAPGEREARKGWRREVWRGGSCAHDELAIMMDLEPVIGFVHRQVGFQRNRRAKFDRGWAVNQCGEAASGIAAIAAVGWAVELGGDPDLMHGATMPLPSAPASLIVEGETRSRRHASVTVLGYRGGGLPPGRERGRVMGRFLSNVVTVILAVCFVGVLALRVTEGSFEAAGAKLDEWLPIAYQEASEVARDLGEEAEQVARDIADGPDEGNQTPSDPPN